MSNNVVYLDRNENNYGPAPACFEVLKKADLTKLSWYDRSFTTGSKGILSARLAHDLDWRRTGSFSAMVRSIC